MTYEALDLVNTIKSNWNLTGERLALEGTAAADGLKRPLRIFAHQQQPTQLYTNSIEVINRGAVGIDFVSEFFKREETEFEILITHNREGVDPVLWDQHETDLEDIENEIDRILNLIYDPSAGIGVYFSKNESWQNQDEAGLAAEKPFLKRFKVTRLSKITPRKTTSFITYKRAVLIDVSLSEGTGFPGANYQYTEIFNVNTRMGYGDSEVVVADESDGMGIPWHYDTRFSGTFVAQMYMRSSDIGTGTHKINNLWQKLASGERPEITMLRTYNNESGQILTRSDLIKFTDFQEVDPTTALLQANLLGKIIKPGTWTIS